MNILGISDSQDAGAALIKDGEIIAAVNEERLNRVKLFGGLPLLSIQKVLEIGKLTPEQIDLVVLASKMSPITLMRLLRNTHQRLRQRSLQFGYLLNLYLLYQVFAHRCIFPKEIEAFLSSRLIQKQLGKIGLNAKVVTVDHHLAHACAAFSSSNLKRALIFTIDGLGDGLVVTVSIGQENGTVRKIYEQTGLSAITLYYSRITEFLGFIPIKDEGKVTGLAAYGNEGKAIDYAKSLLWCRSKGFNRHNYFLKQNKNRGIYTELKRFARQDTAAAFQHNLENELKKFILFWIKKTGIRDLAFAGGLFANVKLNQRIHRLSEVDSVYIFPHMGDGGLAIGAAFSQIKRPPFRLSNLFFGPEYSNQEIENELKNYNFHYEYVHAIEKKIAQLLAQGKIVARFRGRMEYGPRALGNRSILYQPTDSTTRKWLNRKLDRTDFMPFAPSTLAEYFGQCYLNPQGATYTAEFMNISFDCTEWMKKMCPGIVHVDETARPQLVRRENNPGFYLILDEYRKITGLPSILNTSFNMHEHPIVCTPGEAIEAFKQAQLDYLAIGNYLVRRLTK
ncbi:MAG: carbamoyltransferase [Candidatus Omnitrophota bacterium]|nr:MAG: carbamoyltransferase [Candidatus Omnitrophota bacterium]